jgi:hypothetical protein
VRRFVLPVDRAFEEVAAGFFDEVVLELLGFAVAGFSGLAEFWAEMDSV